MSRAHLLISGAARAPSPLVTETIVRINESHKFCLDPGAVSKEIADGAQQFTRDLLKAGLLPLPYDTILFQFGPGGLTAFGGDCWLYALIWRMDDGTSGEKKILFRVAVELPGSLEPTLGLQVAEVIYSTPHEDGWWGQYQTLGYDRVGLDALKRGKISEPAIMEMAKKFSLQYRRPLDEVLKDMREAVEKADYDHRAMADEAGSLMLENAFYWSLVALGLMHTDGVEQRETKAPKFINQARVKKGKPPLYSYKTLLIDPAALHIPGMSSGGTHASPRVHWRRGHVRTLATGRKTIVRPCLVGDRLKGFVQKEYVIGGNSPSGEAA